MGFIQAKIYIEAYLGKYLKPTLSST